MKKAVWFIWGLLFIVIIGVFVWLVRSPGSRSISVQTGQPNSNGQTVASNASMAVIAGTDGTLSVDLGKEIKMELVPIPAGTFEMGSNKNDDEKPQHPVTFNTPFYMGKYEVTSAQWKAAQMPYTMKSEKCGGNCPIIQVSWDDAQEFIKRLNTKQSQYTFRLPTEAEWEYAARAKTTGDYAGSLDEIAWYDKNSSSTVHAVGQKSANAWNLYDMQGNVWEWVQDWYDKDYYKSAPLNDPKGPSTGQFRVLRGGSWYDPSSYCRVARRGNFNPGGYDDNIGMRLVCVARIN